MGAQKHVLVVEDNPSNYELAEKILQHAGFTSTILVDGAEALQWCQQNPPPAVILMDVSLPSMDGLSVTRQLRELPAYAETPIVALTAHAMLGDEEKALAAGCDRYLAKPFRPRALMALLRELVEQ